LLSNKFADAETFLTKAITLTPTDTFSKQQLARIFREMPCRSDSRIAVRS
jgi:hypothetical protein